MDDLEVYLTAETPNSVLLLSFCLMTLAIAVVLMIRKDIGWMRRWTAALMLVEYVFLALGETVLFRTAGCERIAHLDLFWSYRQMAEDPTLMSMWEIVLNVILFVPIGFLLGIFPSMQKWWKVLLTGLFFSALIEVSQYIWMRGVFEFDDMMHNSLGAVIGYMLSFGTRRTLLFIFRK